MITTTTTDLKQLLARVEAAEAERDELMRALKDLVIVIKLNQWVPVTSPVLQAAQNALAKALIAQEGDHG